MSQPKPGTDFVFMSIINHTHDYIV